jgi:gamma-glutamyltranspeptidase/glutathione hydrolase/leukotriene-C4 hydrolase
MTVYTAPLPGSGVLLAFMLNVLEDLVTVKDERVMYQRIIEAFKWAYAKRTQLGDPDFIDAGS